MRAVFHDVYMRHQAKMSQAREYLFNDLFIKAIITAHIIDPLQWESTSASWYQGQVNIMNTDSFMT